MLGLDGRAIVVIALVAGCSRPPRMVDSLFTDDTGASVIVLSGGQPVVTRAYGLADPAAGVRATPETNYRLASLSKQFTATAIMMLVEKGRLGWDDRVADILPELPPAARQVTIRQLLQHTSGIWDYEDFVRGPEQVHDRDVPALLPDRTYFPPGTGQRYSNSGYALLALVVERKSGQSFAAFLREHIFGPLGMRATVAYEAGISTVERRAMGQPVDQSPTSAVLGDGGIYSSVVDLAAWDRALDAHTLVGAATQELAWTASPRGPYGFGWFVDHDGGRLRLSHHGETCGFTNAIVKYPRERLTVIVLTNRAGGEPWRAAQRIADAYLPGPHPPWPFLALPGAH